MSIRDSWRTPWYLWRYIQDEYDPQLDVCASPDNALCPAFYSEEDSCLTQDWYSGNRVAFCNPPYSNPLPFIQKAIEQKGRVKTVFLLNLDPSTRWFCEALDHACEIVILTASRVKFTPPEGVSESSNSKPQVIIVIGNDELKTKYVNLKNIKEIYL